MQNWHDELYEMKRKEGRGKEDEVRVPEKVSHVIRSADVNNHPANVVERRTADLEEEEEDAKPMTRSKRRKKSGRSSGNVAPKNEIFEKYGIEEVGGGFVKAPRKWSCNSG